MIVTTASKCIACCTQPGTRPPKWNCRINVSLNNRKFSMSIHLFIMKMKCEYLCIYASQRLRHTNRPKIIPFDIAMRPNVTREIMIIFFIYYFFLFLSVKFQMECVIVVQYGNEFGKLILDRMCM